ncbi:MAG: glycosyltransferase family 39 protein [Myxococcales bacterium]|nr:glycosyltransferase family 39 protein [Myxococcales bacterium]
MAALIFSLFGPRPLALVSVPFVGMLLMVALAFDVLRKRVGSWPAFASVLTLAFASMAINMPMLYVMRQTMATLMVAGVWLLDGAQESRWPLLRYFAGSLVMGLGLYVDAFAVVLVPACATFALACCADRVSGAKQLLLRTGGCLAGVALGLVPAQLLGHLGTGGPGAIAFDRLSSNWKLLWDYCLPFAFSYGVWVPGKSLYAQPWESPAALHVVQVLGAGMLGLAILFGLVSGVLRAVPWPVRRLGLLGFLSAAFSLAAFLLSGMPVDIWSARYLAPLFWTAPFALAPAAYLLKRWAFCAALSPYLLVAAIGGWMSYGNFVSGPLPVLDARGKAEDEDALGEFLRQRGIKYGAAQYWLAYRLTFIFRENPTVVPLNPGEDRYPPYRRGFEQADELAFIFHPSEPRALPEPQEAHLRASRAKFERHEVRGFTVFLVSR